MKIQENLYIYKSFKIGEEIIKTLTPYEGLKNILNLTLQINNSIKIPIEELLNKKIYSIRFVPNFFHAETDFIEIPTIVIEYETIDSEGNIHYKTDDIEIKAKYNIQNPGYAIESIFISYKYLVSLLKGFVIDIQFAEHLDFYPLEDKNKYYDDLGFYVFKDGIYNEDYINSNASHYNLLFDSFNITNSIQSFNRSPFFSIKYPVYREMMLASVMLLQKNNSNNITGISYDESFYKKLGVPLNRSLSFSLKFSGSLQNFHN